MGDSNPFVSNGTCYYRFEKALDKKFIPCGNVAFGHVHCCQTSDVCLEHGACYNNGAGTTYLAGCTDRIYLDASCPDKDSYYGRLAMTSISRMVCDTDEFLNSRPTLGRPDLLRG